MTSTADTRVQHILVVDDEPALRDLLTDALAGRNVEIRTAAGRAEAIEIAQRVHPDLLITDYCLADCTGTDIIEAVQKTVRDIPAVVITGHADPATLTAASRSGPIEIMTKPLDLKHLRHTVGEALAGRSRQRHCARRTARVRKLAREANHQRKAVSRQLETTCADLAAAYRSLSSQLSVQQCLIEYQQALLPARTDDDVFRALFRTFVQRSGSIYGAAMVCDADAQLRIVGRFGVPEPDCLTFCRTLAEPVIESVLSSPLCNVVDAGDHADEFDESIRKYLPGLSILAIPLIPAEGELIGLVVLYRKGEQPFTDADLDLAYSVAHATAIAVRRND